MNLPLEFFNLVNHYTDKERQTREPILIDVCINNSKPLYDTALTPPDLSYFSIVCFISMSYVLNFWYGRLSHVQKWTIAIVQV